MKLRAVVLTVSLLASGSVKAAQFDGGFPGEFDHFHVSVCKAHAFRCYSLHAAKATGSSLKALFALDELSVQVVDPSGNSQAPIEAWPHGYFDLQLQRIVVWRDEGGHRIEKVYEP